MSGWRESRKIIKSERVLVTVCRDMVWFGRNPDNVFNIWNTQKVQKFSFAFIGLIIECVATQGIIYGTKEKGEHRIRRERERELHEFFFHKKTTQKQRKLLCLCDIFWALINSLVCWFYWVGSKPCKYFKQQTFVTYTYKKKKKKKATLAAGLNAN